MNDHEFKLKTGESVIVWKEIHIQNDTIQKTLSSISSNKNSFLSKAIEHDRYVGSTNIIKTRDEGYITYYQLKDKLWYRVKLTGYQEKTPKVTVLLKKLSKDEYLLLDAWLGEYVPNPDEDELLEQFNITRLDAIHFWQNHAWVRSSLDLPDKYKSKKTYRW